jgi:hypothetical protein
MVNGRSTRITQSLAIALSSLRTEDTDLILWADALCINQQDPVERTVQVQLMRQIYESAQRVILWLGPSTPETDCTIQETRKLGSKLLDETEIWDIRIKDLIDFDLVTEDDSDLARSKRRINAMVNDLFQRIQDGEDPLWWIKSDLGERSWWTRIWCIQELSNAREAIFRCGYVSFAYELQFDCDAVFGRLFTTRCTRSPK